MSQEQFQRENSASSLVAVRQVDYGAEDLEREVHDQVRAVMEAANWQEFIEPDEKICLKPNLCIDITFPGFVTSPWVLKSVIRVLKDKTQNIVVIENDTWTSDADKAVRNSGLMAVIEEEGVQWCNLSKDRWIDVTLKNSLVLPNPIKIPELLTQCKLVTVPVLKTHGNTTITGAVKNQYGCISKGRLAYHEVIDKTLVDINRLFKPVFCIVDGTIGSEGNGPKEGNPRICNLLLASADNVAIDTISTRLMGIKEEITHLRLNQEHGLGNQSLERIQLVGDSISNINLKFSHNSKSLLTILDLWLRKPGLKWLIYSTFIFKIVLVLAKANYPIWMFICGKRRRDRAIASRYGTQWKT